MNAFLIEFAIVHFLLFVGYWLILRQENQFGKRRSYLLGSTVLALIIPFLKLPSLFSWKEESIATLAVQAMPMEVVAVHSTADAAVWSDAFLLYGYVAISLCFLLRFVWGLLQLMRMRLDSRHTTLGGYRVRLLPSFSGCFSFFNMIFIGDEMTESDSEKELILRHEEAHVMLGHSYDLFFFEIIRVLFWWLPTTWYNLREIKEIHEYQADAHVIEAHDLNRYSTTLINTTLKSHGLQLASSFDDSLIIKRIEAMKEQVTNISQWKIGLLALLCLSVVVLFACTEERSSGELDSLANSSIGSQAEIFTVVEEQPSFKGGMDEFYKYLMQEMRYPRQAREGDVEGVVEVQFVVERDGKITNVEAVKGIGSGCDEEAVRVLSNAPAFIPGSQRGRTVRVRMQMPISFKLNPGKLNPDNTTQGNVIMGAVQSENQKLKIDADHKNGAWSGTIYSHEGDPLPGVNIYIDGTTRGTVSDLDGTFSLKVGATETITISFVGYESVKITSEYRSR